MALCVDIQSLLRKVAIFISHNVLRICAVRNNETLKLTTNAEKRIAHIRC